MAFYTKKYEEADIYLQNFQPGPHLQDNTS